MPPHRLLNIMKLFFTLTLAGIAGAATTAGMPMFFFAPDSTMMEERRIRFEKNSRQMLDKYLENTPRMFRQKAKKNIDKAIADVCGDVVKEDDLYEVVRRTAPKPFQKSGFDILDEHRTRFPSKSHIHRF